MRRFTQCGVAVKAAIVLAIAAFTADAHLVDAYLQAAQISIQADRVDVELNLTPGILLVPAILSSIDGDADGVLSPSEIRAYAERVLRNLSLQEDGRNYQLQLRTVSVDPVADLHEGLGSIHIAYVANLAGLEGGGHRLTFRNGFEDPIGIYLANAMRPASDLVTIQKQWRDPRQQQVSIDYRLATSAWWPQARLPILGLLGLLLATGANFAFRPLFRSQAPARRIQGAQRKAC